MLFCPSRLGRRGMFSQSKSNFRSDAMGCKISILEAYQCLVLWLFPALVFNSNCFHPQSPCPHPFLASRFPFQYCVCLHSFSLLCSIQFYPDPRVWNARPGACLSHAAEIAGWSAPTLFYCISGFAPLFCFPGIKQFLLVVGACMEGSVKALSQLLPTVFPIGGLSPCVKAFGRVPDLLSCQVSLYCLSWSPQNPGSLVSTASLPFKPRSWSLWYACGFKKGKSHLRVLGCCPREPYESCIATPLATTYNEAAW